MLYFGRPAVQSIELSALEVDRSWFHVHATAARSLPSPAICDYFVSDGQIPSGNSKWDREVCRERAPPLAARRPDAVATEVYGYFAVVRQRLRRIDSINDMRIGAETDADDVRSACDMPMACEERCSGRVHDCMLRLVIIIVTAISVGIVE